MPDAPPDSQKKTDVLQCSFWNSPESLAKSVLVVRFEGFDQVERVFGEESRAALEAETLRWLGEATREIGTHPHIVSAGLWVGSIEGKSEASDAQIAEAAFKDLSTLRDRGRLRGQYWLNLAVWLASPTGNTSAQTASQHLANAILASHQPLGPSGQLVKLMIADDGITFEPWT